jgi:NADH-quinone oxidoreductase subunit N
LAVYLFMNMAAFATIAARERETSLGDSVTAMRGLGRERPHLAWPMTLAMLGLSGIPATAGFMGKFYLIDASVSGGYTWLGVVIVIGSMISLGYYLPVIAAMWMSEAPRDAPGPVSEGALPTLAGGSQDLDEQTPTATGPQPEVTLVAIVAGTAILFFGIVPQPLFNLVHGVGSALGLL